jgi:hypothetical protein
MSEFMFDNKFWAYIELLTLSASSTVFDEQFCKHKTKMIDDKILYFLKKHTASSKLEYST